MLRLVIPSAEMFDDEKQEFINLPSVEVVLEHSLVSLSKWESKWEKPFLTSSEKTTEETLSYVECMIVSPENSLEVIFRFTEEHFSIINDYINGNNTATSFRNDEESKRSTEIVTSELIYYWMISLNIPFECQYWHINRLITLIKVCNLKNSPPKKRTPREIATSRAKLNAERRAKLSTRG